MNLRAAAAIGCVSQPRHRGIMIDPGDTDQTIRVEYAQAAVMKFDDAFLAQRA